MRRLSPLLAKQPSLTPQGFQNTAQGRGSAPWEGRQPPAGSTRNGLDLAGPALCNPCGVGSGWDGFASQGALPRPWAVLSNPFGVNTSRHVFQARRSLNAWIPGNPAKDSINP